MAVESKPYPPIGDDNLANLMLTVIETNSPTDHRIAACAAIFGNELERLGYVRTLKHWDEFINR